MRSGWRIWESRELLFNSLKEPHPPLYYVLLWIGSGGGSSHSELAWRWLSIVWGVLSIGLIWKINAEFVDDLSRALIALIMVTSPCLVFYSQEARSYGFAFLMTSISIWVVLQLIKHPESRRLWFTWAAACLVGIYSNYGLLMVVGIQVIYLCLLNYRLSIWWKSVLLLLIGLIPLVRFGLKGLIDEAAKIASTGTLTFVRTIQTLLAGEQAWYETTPAHTLFPFAAAGLILLSFLRAFRKKDVRLAYLILQLILPIFVLFAILPFFDVHFAMKHSRFFIVLLPVIFILIAVGFAEIREFFRPSSKSAIFVPVGIGLLLTILNIRGLVSYYATPKNSAALAVFSLQDKIKPGERVVSTNYRFDYSLDFYTHGIKTYINPLPGTKNPQAVRFQLVETQQIFEQVDSLKHDQSIEDIRRNRIFWLLSGAETDPHLIQQITEDCEILEQEKFVTRHEGYAIKRVKCP